MATIIKMPALSDTMTEGVLVAWHKKTGDKVSSGDLLAEIETDKAVMEFESFFNGTLLYATEAGQSIKVDAVIAIIGDPSEDWKSLLANASAATPAVTATPDAPAKQESAAPVVQTPATTPVASDEEGRLKASPLAKALAKDAGINIGEVKGSGDDGRIVKRDVEAFIETRSTSAPATTAPAAVQPNYAAFTAEGEFTDVPVSQMRKTIARRLSESKFSAPEFYLTMEINMDKCMAARTALNEVSPVKISFNDIVIKATAMALRRHPAINASWLGDKIRYYSYVNMGVAVAVDEGLLVPVIRRADVKSLSEIAAEVRELAEKAKERKIQPSEMQGNTFTISNLGMFGIDEFTAIINPPDACILAVGGISERAVRNADGSVGFSSFMKVTLTCDHRVVDGASGAKFLQLLRDMLQDPLRIIL